MKVWESRGAKKKSNRKEEGTGGMADAEDRSGKIGAGPIDWGPRGGFTKRSEQGWLNWITENGSYKLVALFVTLILWVTILGRGDIVMTRDIALEFLLPRNMAIAERFERKVSVKVSGPRMALKKFTQNSGVITVDLSRAPAGRTRALISNKNVDVPFGVKVLDINPPSINVTLIPVGNNGPQIDN